MAGIGRGIAEGVGLDFGTTNSAVAVSRRDGPEPATTRFAEFPTSDGVTSAFRSVLYFGRDDPRAELECWAGPEAIERYLEAEEERRLMQSLKSFLASRLFKATNLFGRPTSLEELVGRILRPLGEEMMRERGISPDAVTPGDTPIVVGRPVRFAKSEGPEDDAFALDRLRDALERGGWPEVTFEYEPVAAAYHYEKNLTRDELALVADFGGGTSDFCLLHVGPSRRQRTGEARDILGTEGVAIAGDSFDAKIVREVVAPRLGRGSTHTTLFGSRVPVPRWLYRDLERWHHLSFLKSRKTLGLLHDVLNGAERPDAIRALLHVVEADLGFQLYRAVERTKRELSEQDESWLRFHHPPAELEVRVSRQEFDAWIADELSRIDTCVDRLLEKTATRANEVDCVFMTGGSAFVPAVRELFASRFGADRIRSGGELVSVASGLSLRALDLA